MIRVVFGATVAALMFAQAAVAQTPLAPACASFTPAPTVPDGATATNAAMNAAREALAQWRSTRATEIAACKAIVDQTAAQLNALENAHNRAVTETDAAIAHFAAENAEYTARARPRREDR